MYRGSGTASAIDAAGNFTADLTADRYSGSSLCPDHAAEHLTGVCRNGKVVITTNYGKLDGDFSKNGGTAKGTVTISPGINVDLSIQFQRAS
jgi:hypothetical protein